MPFAEVSEQAALSLSQLVCAKIFRVQKFWPIAYSFLVMAQSEDLMWRVPAGAISSAREAGSYRANWSPDQRPAKKRTVGRTRRSDALGTEVRGMFVKWSPESALLKAVDEGAINRNTTGPCGG